MVDDHQEHTELGHRGGSGRLAPSFLPLLLLHPPAVATTHWGHLVSSFYTIVSKSMGLAHELRSFLTTHPSLCQYLRPIGLSSGSGSAPGLCSAWGKRAIYMHLKEHD